MFIFIPTTSDQGETNVSHPCNTPDEIDLAQAELREAGLAEAEVWAGDPDCPDCYRTSDTLFANDAPAEPEPITDPRYLALAKHLEVSPETIDECNGSGPNMYENSEAPGEYCVLLDSEADAMLRVWVESYIDDVVLDGADETLARYLDHEAFIRDVEISDGRGPSLAAYDSTEHEVMIDGIYYYIYRVN